MVRRAGKAFFCRGILRKKLKVLAEEERELAYLHCNFGIERFDK